MRTARQKGFTLIELLVVIAILAVLVTAIVVILNPAELLKQARDSTRLSDTKSLVKAIDLFFADGQTWSTAAHNCTVGIVSPMITTLPTACVTNALTNITGTGWIPLNFTALSTGSPLSSLPLDPVNNATYYYAFKSTTAMTFEINANMESTKFSSGSNNVEINSKDGGNNAGWYEVGNDPGLDL